MKNLENLAHISHRICGSALSSMADKDSRADNGQREIFCTAGQIRLKRCMRGIGMNIDIATRSYTGVVLSLLIRADGVSYYRISLSHRDPDLAIILFEAYENCEVVAIWKAWARYFALPRLLEHRPGHVTWHTRQIGATVLGDQPLWRRSGGMLAQRKPKQLTRRRAAHAMLKAVPEYELEPAALDL